MGGNVFKDLTRRYDADEYHALSNRVLGYLKIGLPNTRMEIIPAYSTKESFGDCDILIESTSLPTDWIDKVKTALLIRDVVKNGSVLSLPFRQFQFDLITAPANEFDFSLYYFIPSISKRRLQNQRCLNEIVYRVGIV